MEVNNYYPGVYPERSPIAIGRRRFLNSSLSYSRSGNRYKYQTKEVDNYMDYNILDFGARHYDAAAARWTVYDPASQYATPYIAMGGNPVSGIDPTGTVSHRLSDSQASLAASNSYMDNINNGGQPMNYAMWSNVSSAGRGGGQTYYEIGLQTGSTSMTMYQDARGNFYANANSASNATGISYNDILGMSSGDKLYQYSNQDLGALDAKGHGAHLNIISQNITGSYDIAFDGLSFKQYTGDVTWKFGNEDAPDYENNLFSYTERFERKFRNSGPWGVITTTKYSSITTGDALINITRTHGNTSNSITGTINHSYGPLKGTLDSNTNLSISFGGFSTGFGPEGITLGFSSTVHNLEIGSEFTFMPNENFLNAAIFVGCIVQPELTPFLIK